MPSSVVPLVLEAVAGPHPLRAELRPGESYVLGRATGCGVLLDDPSTIVSRRHALIAVDDAGGWRLSDLESRHGTRLNGVTLAPDQAVALRGGDLISIGPWTLMVAAADPHSAGAVARLATEDDRGTASRAVRAFGAPADAALASDRLRLLLEVAERIHRADSLAELAAGVIDTLAAGTRFGNVALLRPMAADGSVEVIALRTENDVRAGEFRFSRSILQQAATGAVATRSNADMPVDTEMSILKLDISEAVCIPLMADGVVIALLYMDNRHGRRAARGGADDREFATALGRMASLAIRNLMHRDFEARFAAAQAELAAAAQMQRMILPSDSGAVEGVRYAGHYRPGRVVSGDFYDVMPLAPGRSAVVIGDVSGKGVAASVLATLTQGFLRGTLRDGSSIDEALRALHGFLWTRAEAERFVTLWLGIVDGRSGLLTYVDAGHGHTLLVDSAGKGTVLSERGGPPLGAVARPVYQTAQRELAADATLLLVSDGVLEQPSPPSPPGAAGAAPGGDETVRFGRERLLAAVGPRMSVEEVVSSVFGALSSFAGGDAYADDATVVAVRRAAPDELTSA